MIDESIMYSEVYEILLILGPKYIEKIPPQLYEYIKNKRNKHYACNINNHETIENQNLMNETIEFISCINLKYWVNKKEHNRLISIYNRNEDIFNEKYNRNNIFKNEAVKNKELAIVKSKTKNWHEKLFYTIKKLFKIE